MHPGANSCERISVERRTVARRFTPSVLIRFSLSGAILFVLLVLSGCSSSSPRFTSAAPAPKPPPVAPPAAPEIPDTTDTEAPPADTAVTFNPDEAIVSDSENNTAIDRHLVLTRIMAMMGTPYIYNGDDSTGIDCSAFTLKIYDECLGVTLPRSSVGQFGVGRAVRQRRLKFGDLVFFHTRGRAVNHVGIYVGNGLFAHASVSLGVTISLLSSTYYKHRYLGARRVVE